MELAVVARRAIAVLEDRGAAVERAYLGTFLSALDMAGASLSVLPVDDDRLAHLDAPTDAPAWPNAAAQPRRRSSSAEVAAPVGPVAPPAPLPPRTPAGVALGAAIQAAAGALIEAGPRLTEMDQAVGDGDLGISLERGSRAVQQALPAYPLDEPAAALHALAVTLQRSLGGTSGPLLAAFFLRASASLARGAADDARSWATAVRAGCEAIAELGGAAPGDRTMLDSLLPAAAALEAAADLRRPLADALRSAADAAAEGARATARMAPRRGR